MRFCAVILAAGRSTRMGEQKLLLPWRGGTVIGHIVHAVVEAGPVEARVVVPVDQVPVQAALAGLPVRLIVNPDGGSDMLASVRCGLRDLPAECEAVLVAPGDHPGITAALIGRMLAALADPRAGMVVPVHGGRRGHPLLLRAGFVPSILVKFDDLGLRGLLQAHPDQVRELAVNDRAVTEDLDTPEDYLRLRETSG